jgi:hypothetical protein
LLKRKLAGRQHPKTRGRGALGGCSFLSVSTRTDWNAYFTANQRRFLEAWVLGRYPSGLENAIDSISIAVITHFPDQDNSKSKNDRDV